MLHLFAFEDTTPAQDPLSTILLYVVLGLMVVGLIVYYVISSKKRKKKEQEMMSKIEVGATVTTYAGMVGKIVKLDDNNFWLETGDDDNKVVLQFLRAAIYAVHDPNQQKPTDANAPKEEEVDEIK